MAALGIDARNQTYREPASYTSHLSGLVKISQMLVARQAVHLAEDGHVEHPGDAINEMRDRFLLYGVRVPFGWITRLRTYGKRIQNTSTSLGYLIWERRSSVSSLPRAPVHHGRTPAISVDTS